MKLNQIDEYSIEYSNTAHAIVFVITPRMLEAWKKGKILLLVSGSTEDFKALMIKDDFGFINVELYKEYKNSTNAEYLFGYTYDEFSHNYTLTEPAKVPKSDYIAIGVSKN